MPFLITTIGPGDGHPCPTPSGFPETREAFETADAAALDAARIVRAIPGATMTVAPIAHADIYRAVFGTEPAHYDFPHAAPAGRGYPEMFDAYNRMHAAQGD